MEHLRELITSLQLSDIPLKQGEPLLRHTSFQIGGPAAVMVFPASETHLKDIFALCRQYQVAPLILGGGTNVLCPDQGLDTLIIETKTNFHALRDLGGGVLEAQGGAMLSRFAAFAQERGRTGLEFAHGIPGTVGGGIYMNAGAYGGEMKQVVEGVTFLKPDGTIVDISGTELDLSYRHSRFMTEPGLILRVRVRLEQDAPEAIRSRMAELMRRRKSSQPLEYPSAGSTFKRPAGGYAAALIDEAGLKGLTVGGAQVSEKHAGFVINQGGATCQNVLDLMAQVQEKVLAHSGVALEPEVRVWEVPKSCNF